MDATGGGSLVRVPIYVRFYFWVGLVLIGIAPFLYITGKIYDGDHVEEGLTSFLASVAAFQALFWFARRRCSTGEHSAWNGLLLINAYMCIGIGGMSLIVAVAAGSFAVVAMVAIAVVSLVHEGKQGAVRNFWRLVAWFGRHRMYQ